jgi:UPF0716 protein FxsA
MGTGPVRPPRTRFVVLLIVLLMLMAEFWVLGRAAALVGWPVLLLLLAAQAVGGIVVMRRAGGSAIRSLLSGVGDPEDLGRHAALFTGGLLLALPGLLTDLFALPFLVPPTRRGIGQWAGRRMFGRLRGPGGFGPGGPGGPGPVIQGEVIRDEPDDPPASGGLSVR